MQRLNKKIKSVFSAVIILLIIPATVLVGVTVFKNRQYAFFSLAVALLSCVPVFIGFEKGSADGIKLVLTAVMISLSVVGRFFFAPIPFFKPVTALTVITAMYLGAESGFVVGALSAVISNLYFGQGPWTPFQMFAWGMLGFLGGIIAKQLKKSRILLYIYGVFAGVFYSIIMDVFSVLWQDGFFSLPRYAAMVLSSAQITAVYALSNVVFLRVAVKPIGEKFERMKTKYGL